MKVIDIDRSMGIDRWANIETHRGARNIASKRPGCDARVTEKAIHASSIGMAVMDWIDDDATDRGARRRTRPSTDSRPIDRSFASIESSSSTGRIVATEDSFIHSIARSIRRSVDGWNGMEWHGMEWHGMDGHHIHPSTTHTHTDRRYIYTRQ